VGVSSGGLSAVCHDAISVCNSASMMSRRLAYMTVTVLGSQVGYNIIVGGSQESPFWSQRKAKSAKKEASPTRSALRRLRGAPGGAPAAVDGGLSMD